MPGIEEMRGVSDSQRAVVAISLGRRAPLEDITDSLPRLCDARELVCDARELACASQALAAQFPHVIDDELERAFGFAERALRISERLAHLPPLVCDFPELVAALLEVVKRKQGDGDHFVEAAADKWQHICETERRVFDIPDCTIASW